MAIWNVDGISYTTIQGALDALFASVGTNTFTETQTIRVFDGTYKETATTNATMVPTSAYRLVIEVAAGNTAILSGDGFTIDYGLIINNHYTTVDGFKVTAFAWAGVNYSGLNYGEIKNCEFYGHYVFTLRVNACYYTETHHCICHDNGSHGLDGEGGGSCKIHDCILYNEAGYGAISGGANYSDLIYNNIIYNCAIAISMYGRGQQGVYNNTIYGCTQGIHMEDGNTAVYVKNNLIFASGAGKYCQHISAISDLALLDGYDYNLYYVTDSAIVGKYAGTSATTLADWQALIEAEANSVEDDPLLANPTTDFHLLVGSPAIGVAANLSGSFTDDYAGLTRTVPWDIGAYKYSADVNLNVILSQVDELD